MGEVPVGVCPFSTVSPEPNGEIAISANNYPLLKGGSVFTSGIE